MAFVRTKSGGTNYASPGELYRDLPRRPGAVPGLWAHQSEMLKTFTSHANKPDIALELPTGTGKTLTGLLIAEWTRHSRRSRVIYACPTQQLARQVAAAAYREGIETALLIGRHTDWPVSSHAAYEAAEAIAVTTYSSIFNSNPHLAEADLILFDDAHAGEQYVGEAYSVDLSRWKSPTEYITALDTIAPALDGIFLERLRNAQPDPGISADVRLVLPLRQSDMVTKLDASLGSFSAPHNYSYSMIRAGLASCLVYVAYSGILIRPYLPPTHQNHLFSGARQRVYLSATLGEGGELERAFGRAGILRLEQPDESTAPRYGRRFFVFPEFVEGGDTAELSRAIVAEAGKALVLSPRTETAMADASALAQPGWPVWGVDQVADGMDAFAKLEHGACGLAARYDGLDLPGDACRLVALDGVPDQDNLQERFLQSRARAGAALAARVRTRVIQGAGRCTRGPGDTAVVLVLSSDLSRYLTRPEVVAALDAELQAEIRFGRENSQTTSDHDVLSNVQAFLRQHTDESWRTQAEPALTDYRREMPQRMPEGTAALSSCVQDEIQAWAAATIGAWADASRHAHEVARLAGTGGVGTAGYRAFWIYLEAAWADLAAEQTGDGAGRAAAQRLVRLAEQVMGLGSWVRQMAPFPAMQRPALCAVDAHAVNTIATKLDAGVNQGTIRRRIGEMHAGLDQRDPSKYEPALTELGKLVGATASKPPGAGRCDSTWCWGNELWLALEAKSDHEPTGVVPHKDIRQANDQLRLLAADRGVDAAPAESATVVISPKPSIHDDGIKGAETHVHLIAPSTMIEIAFDVSSVWEELLARSANRTLQELRQLVADTFNARGILPSQLLERVTHDPVAAKGL
ncbi:DEAD/DEAH box helicase [Arthrobacter sp. STN4]|uniref:DEAD/DEAH box helicase n=1 Tax=Arthrobacter sp. STN4 TaxID=2923276 RepID=UPI0035BFCFE2